MSRIVPATGIGRNAQEPKLGAAVHSRGLGSGLSQERAEVQLVPWRAGGKKQHAESCFCFFRELFGLIAQFFQSERKSRKRDNF